MSNDILSRFVLAIAIIGAGLLAYWLANRWLLRRAAGRLGELMSHHPHGPVLVYFTTPTCAPCKTVQEPAIEQVRRRLNGGLHVVQIDAAERPELARRWGVMSVPTTFVLDARGEARYVNNGVARADKLLRQIQAV
jgi:thiol-disulfide isomerase/thioredoxin